METGFNIKYYTVRSLCTGSKVRSTGWGNGLYFELLPKAIGGCKLSNSRPSVQCSSKCYHYKKERKKGKKSKERNVVHQVWLLIKDTYRNWLITQFTRSQQPQLAQIYAQRFA